MIKKTVEELKALQDRSAELEKRRADLEMLLKSLMAQLDQERAKEAYLRSQQERAKEAYFRGQVERIGAYERAEGQVRDDQGRGMEGKLDAILKKLESIEKRLSDLEKKVQPDRRKK